MNGLSAQPVSEPSVSDETQKNTAWVAVEIPVHVNKLFDFLRNPERLFRLNPYLDIREWEEMSATKQFHLKALNEMNGVTYDHLITIELVELNARILLSYDKGLKRALEISLLPGPSGTILTLREHYYPPPQSGEYQEEQLKEVDHGLLPWAASIRKYFFGLEKWGWLRPYRWYKESFWLGMRPTHRRISRMIIWVTVFEFVVFLFVFTIYWLELARKG